MAEPAIAGLRCSRAGFFVFDSYGEFFTVPPILCANARNTRELTFSDEARKFPRIKLKTTTQTGKWFEYVLSGAPIRATSRTITPIIRNLVKYFLDNPQPLGGDSTA